MKTMSKEKIAMDFIEAMNLEDKYENFIDERIAEDEEESGSRYGTSGAYDCGYSEYDEKFEELYDNEDLQLEFIEEAELERKLEIFAVIAMGVSVR